jgi:microcystin-dependent protein
LTGMAAAMAANSGGSQAHNNMQPFMAINFIIALIGIYPSRS